MARTINKNTIWHLMANPEGAENRQIGRETRIDSKLNKKMWWGKGDDGVISRFLEKNELAYVTGIQDQYLTSPLPISESGVAALTTTSQSAVGAINEVNAKAEGLNWRVVKASASPINLNVNEGVMVVFDVEQDVVVNAPGSPSADDQIGVRAFAGKNVITFNATFEDGTTTKKVYPGESKVLSYQSWTDGATVNRWVKFNDDAFNGLNWVDYTGSGGTVPASLGQGIVIGTSSLSSQTDVELQINNTSSTKRIGIFCYAKHGETVRLFPESGSRIDGVVDKIINMNEGDYYEFGLSDVSTVGFSPSLNQVLLVRV